MKRTVVPLLIVFLLGAFPFAAGAADFGLTGIQITFGSRIDRSPRHREVHVVREVPQRRYRERDHWDRGRRPRVIVIDRDHRRHRCDDERVVIVRREYGERW